MTQTEIKDLIKAGVHFGHLTRKWNPNMAPYIYMERNGIHIINLYKTAAKILEAQNALKKIAVSGRKILFVATKKQAKDIVSEHSRKINMPYITERWPGGMLTNFVTIRKAVKKMGSIDRMKKDGTFETLSKKERLQIERMRAKLEKNLGSISDMTRLPGAIFVVDIKRENIAIKEAQKLNIPIFAMVDTNSDPKEVDYVIPSNDDASKSIQKVLGLICNAISEGLSERKNEKDAMEKDAESENLKREINNLKEEVTVLESQGETKEESSRQKEETKELVSNLEKTIPTEKKAISKKGMTPKTAPKKVAKNKVKE
tara:strand:- start:24054 stop:24998 length:945 start_codon:yes stop_codon:yes gene_type:complete